MTTEDNTIRKGETMRNLSVQTIILVSVIAICFSSIAIAFITTSDDHVCEGRPHMMMQQQHQQPRMRGDGHEQHKRRGKSKNFKNSERGHR